MTLSTKIFPLIYRQSGRRRRFGKSDNNLHFEKFLTSLFKLADWQDSPA